MVIGTAATDLDIRQPGQRPPGRWPAQALGSLMHRHIGDASDYRQDVSSRPLVSSCRKSPGMSLTAIASLGNERMRGAL